MANNQEKGFHITITDLENDKVLVDTDSNSIIGSINLKNGQNAIAYSRANAIDIAVNIISARDAIMAASEALPDFVKVLMIEFEKDRNEKANKQKDGE